MCAAVSTKHVLCPILGLIELQRLFLAGAGFRFEVVYPAHQGRKAHQNRLGSTACFQTKNRAAVVQKIEFDVTSSAIELVLTFVLAIWLMHADLCYWKIGIQESIPGILHERKELVTLPLKIIEENTADATHFGSVLKSE